MEIKYSDVTKYYEGNVQCVYGGRGTESIYLGKEKNSIKLMRITGSFFRTARSTYFRKCKSVEG